MKTIILISSLVVVYSLPQYANLVGNDRATVEIERQHLVELKSREIDQFTRDILDKIERVNENQGYAARSPAAKPQQHIPHYYSYSHQQPKPTGKYFYAVPEGQSPDPIKRKITHQETYVMPVVVGDSRNKLDARTIENVIASSQLLPGVLGATYFNPSVAYSAWNQVDNPSSVLMINSLTTIEEYDSCNPRTRPGKALDRDDDDDDEDSDFGVEIADEARSFVMVNRSEKVQQATDDDEAAKGEEKDVATNDKKAFSKDNIGDGIFIRRLKVRKGGVAIAGPGGIATAGSGGTAIVGPNGWAYTHPDSLAIAGSGTKVIAVDPSVRLGDVIRNNATRKGVLNTRLGKVVAVGPVIYYNKG